MGMELLIGTYTQPIRFGTGETLYPKGAGIYSIGLDPVSGILSAPKLLARSDNPSYLAVAPDGKTVYAVNELKSFGGRDSGAVTAFRREQSGALRPMDQVPTLGGDPCHVVIDPDADCVFVANFMGGSVISFPLRADGRFAGPGCFFQHYGSGPDPVRQQSPHAHSVVVDAHRRRIHVPDLGCDRIFCYTYDPSTAVLSPVDSAFPPLPSGSGPRHLVFDAELQDSYIVGELNSTVLHCRQTAAGTYALCDVHSTVEEGQQRSNICADLHLTPDGRYLYASNRGADTLVCFAVARDSGALQFAGRYDCGGKTPRSFAIDPTGRYLVTANQDSDTVCAFRIGEDGSLVMKSVVEVPTPVCIKFLKNEVET